MASRSRHPDKDIEKSIQYAEDRGWEVQDSGSSSHAWGRLFCPLHTRDGHIISVWSTPRSAVAHARMIRKSVDKCNHGGGE